MRVVDTYRSSVDPALELGYGRGRPRPLFKGAAPKVLLSWRPRAQLLKIHEAHADEAAAEGIGSTWDAFRAYFAAIRKAGYYFSHGELEPAVGGLAVPLLNAEREAVAALALVGTNEALDEVGEKRMRTLLARARADIEAGLANPPAPPAPPAPPLPRTR
jgi:DNA-binding IclR family transcriptional regulator